MVDSLISEVKLKGGFPDDNYFTNAEMLLLMNDSLRTVITPLLMKIKEEVFVRQKEYTISPGGAYRIPKRCIGNKLRDVKLKDGDDYTNLNRLFEEDRQDKPSGYYIENNSITLSDDIESGTLVISYFLAPSQLVLEVSAAEIISIDSATQVTVASLPSAITTSTPVDLVQNEGPYDLLEIDQSIVSISGTTLTFATLPNDLAVGDWVCLAGQSPVLIAPRELQPLLVQSTLHKSLMSKKDINSAKEAKQELEEMKMDLLNMLDTKVESNDIKFSGQGLLSYVRSRR